MRRVEVVPHRSAWKLEFETEADQIEAAIGKAVIAIHHIGSTAIPSIYAKPIIDFLVEVKNIAQVDQSQPAMEALGYEAMGEYGIPGRRFFRKDNAAGIRTHHVHVFEVGSEHIDRHLAFRDYLIAHPVEAQNYSNLKRDLANRYAYDIESYMDGKDGFIKAIEKQAIAWRASLEIFE